MAKRNKSKLKKRKRRQLKKAFKHSENHSEKQLLQNAYLPPYREPKQDTNKKHEERNKAYQSALDKVYDGTVIPLANYANAKCIILHKCTECGKEFYAKCGWLISKEDQRHVCGGDTKKIRHKKV